MNIVVNQNVVPGNSPRKVVLTRGILYRFGFQPIPGSNMSKVGEVVFAAVPPVKELEAIQQEYCRTHDIDEPFNAADYGYEQ